MARLIFMMRVLSSSLGACRETAKFADLVREAARRDGNVPRSDREPLVVLDDADEVRDVVVIVEGFSDAHDDDVRHLLAPLRPVQMPLRVHDLLHDLARGQVPAFGQ